MPESMNIEVAHKLGEHEHEEPTKRHERWERSWRSSRSPCWRWWRWRRPGRGGRPARGTAASPTSTARRPRSVSRRTPPRPMAARNWRRTWGCSTAGSRPHSVNDTKLMTQYERRFTPDYAVAFNAWLKTGPFTNPKAPAGPGAMPQYDNPYFDKATKLNNQASATFDQGTSARDTADKYVRDTVLFASVLFLVALAQRLKVRGARIALNVVAFGLLVYVLTSVLTLPRL